MNSALQCLSHAAPLTKHFLTNRFKNDLNTSNPLGTGGKLANAYEIVMKEIWMGGHKHRSFSPIALKRAIAMFAPRFAGVSQHDSQEFLAFLLDGLHEDLNRVQNPPYVEKPDVTNGQKLTAAGAEAWAAHCRRNDSLIMDTFYGQFKSTCVCPKCNKISVSFDAFNHVSLEIPQFQNNERIIAVLVFQSVPSTAKDYSPSPPVRYGISVPKNGLVAELKLKLSKLCGIPVARLIFCDVYEHTIYEIITDDKKISLIRTDDFIAAYEVGQYNNSTIHAIATHFHFSDSVGGESNTPARYPFGIPLLTSFDVSLTCRQVFNHIWNQISHLIPDDIQTRDFAKSSLQIRLLDKDGKPFPILKENSLEEVSELNHLSILPKSSNEKIQTHLGPSCTKHFLFIALEWCDSNSDSTFIDGVWFTNFTDHSSLIDAVQKQRSIAASGVTLDRCFENFTRPERLDESNKWYCSSCKEHVRAMKTMELWKLPNILIVHLKRFEYKHAMRRDKLETFVDCPLENFDMSKYCAYSSASLSKDMPSDRSYSDEKDFVVDSVPAIYDLFAVTNHFGRMGFGHYTAYARRWNEHGMEPDWSLFDDASVQSWSGRTRVGGVVTPAAYVLFYRRRVFA